MSVATTRGLMHGSKESLISVNSENYNCLDDDGNLKQYLPSCYIWSGYLPAGRHTIYIFANNQLHYKEVIIGMFPLSECGVPTEIKFPSYPGPLSPELAEELDLEYSQEIQIEKEIEDAAKAEKLRRDAIARSLTAAGKTGKKGKKKK